MIFSSILHIFSKHSVVFFSMVQFEALICTQWWLMSLSGQNQEVCLRIHSPLPLLLHCEGRTLQCSFVCVPFSANSGNDSQLVGIDLVDIEAVVPVDLL